MGIEETIKFSTTRIQGNQIRDKEKKGKEESTLNSDRSETWGRKSCEGSMESTDGGATSRHDTGSAMS